MESSQSPREYSSSRYKTAATKPLIDAVRERAQRGPAKFTLLVPNAAPGLHKVVDPEDQGSGEARAGDRASALPRAQRRRRQRPSRASSARPTRSRRSKTRSTCAASTR